MQRNQGNVLKLCAAKHTAEVSTHEASQEDLYRRKTASMGDLPKTLSAPQRVQETPEESPDSLG